MSATHTTRALACALTLWFFGLAFAASPAVIDLRDAVALLTLYALLATACAFATRAAAGIARPLALLPGLATGALASWHARELFGVPQSNAAFAASTLIAGCLVAAPLLAASKRRTDGGVLWPLAASVIAALLCVAGIASAWHLSDTLRWRILRHNTLFGTPAYYALATPLDEVCEAIWTEHEQAGGELSAPVPAALPRDGTRPNLVLVMLDTLRADALAAYRRVDAEALAAGRAGGIAADPAMPRLDRWARDAAVFTNVHSNSTWTRPSIASLMTGAAPEEHGATDRSYGLPERFELLAETLTASGYRSAAFVSNWAAVGRDAGFDQGYEHFEELAHEPYARADDVARAVREWIGAEDRLSGEQPLFLYLHYLDPHTPYTSGAGRGITPSRRSHSAYRSELRFLDQQLVGLLQELEKRLPGESFFLLISDHGEEFGEHSEIGHGHALYRETGRIPVLLHGLRTRPGLVEARLETRGLHGLLLELLRNPDLRVTDLARARQPAVRRASVESTTPSAWHRPYRGRVCMRSVERDGRELIWSGYGETIELYDLEADPEQRRNLARHEPELARALLAELDDPNWQRGRREAISHTDETFELLCALGYADCDEEGRAGHADPTPEGGDAH